MYKHHSLEERLEAVKLHRSGQRLSAIERQLGVEHHLIEKWIEMYNQHGLEGLRHPYAKDQKAKKITRSDDFSCKCPKKSVNLQSKTKLKSKKRTMGRPKKQEPQTELERLRYENEYLRTEIALIKKKQELMAERAAQRLKIGQKLSGR